jgi:hypothetical protein
MEWETMVGTRPAVRLRLRVLEVDRRGDQRVIGYLGAADLPRGGAPEDVRLVELADRLNQLGILQNRRGAEHEDELPLLRNRTARSGHPPAGPRPTSLFCFHRCSDLIVVHCTIFFP